MSTFNYDYEDVLLVLDRQAKRIEYEVAQRMDTPPGEVRLLRKAIDIIREHSQMKKDAIDRAYSVGIITVEEYDKKIRELIGD